ncbi:MAG TPA: c-type cytochrome, partial [Gemmata sp.]|nr:c-type cytochrome [Gemmata sp.]
MMRISLFLLGFSIVLLPGFASIAISAEEKTGEQIYKQQCARCHGSVGEGTKKYPQPLIGDKSPAGLASIIAKTMPENDPGTCVGEDAKKVAGFIHE